MCIHSTLLSGWPRIMESCCSMVADSKRQTGRCVSHWPISTTRYMRRLGAAFGPSRVAIETHTKRLSEQRKLGRQSPSRILWVAITPALHLKSRSYIDFKDGIAMWPSAAVHDPEQ